MRSEHGRARMRARGAARLAALTAIGALAVAGCGSVDDGDKAAGSSEGGSAETLNVGMMYSMTGPYQSVGTTERQAADLYLKLHNNKLGGRTVKMSYADEGGNSSADQQGMRKLLADDIQVLTGIPDLVTTQTVAPMAKQAGIPAITSAESLVPSPYWWTVSWGLGGEFASMTTYLSKNYKRIATLAGDNASGHAVAGGIVEGFTRGGGEIVAEVYSPAGKTDFQPYLSKIKASNPDAVFAWYAGAEAVAFVKQWAEFGLGEDVQLYGISLTQEPLLEAQGDAALGIRVENEWARDLDTPQNPEFVKAWKDAYGAYPDEFAEWQWASMQIIDQAVTSIKGSVTAAAIQKVLEERPVLETPRGKWQFSADNRPIQHYYVTEVVRNDAGELENKTVTDLGYWAPDGKPAEEPK